jgi:hypothetical protein
MRTANLLPVETVQPLFQRRPEAPRGRRVLTVGFDVEEDEVVVALQTVLDRAQEPAFLDLLTGLPQRDGLQVEAGRPSA